MKSSCPIPSTKEQWIAEIASAYNDAREAIPFGPLVNASLSTADLYQLGPHVCMKFRGLKPSRSEFRKAVEAALASYVVTQEHAGALLDVPQMGFAFTYVATHFSMDLIGERRCTELLEYFEANLQTLVQLTEKEYGNSS